MKKLLFLLVFMGLAVAVFYSCKKDGLNSQTPQSNSNNEQLLNNELWNRIENFKTRMNSADRDLNPISTDSALWYLEAVYNVDLATDTSYENLDLDTTFYTLTPDENGMVDMQQVNQVYNQMVEDLNNNLQSKNNDYAYLIIGDLSPSNASRDAVYTMQLISGIGISPLVCYDPFYDVDDWYYGNMLGRLDGQYVGESDAGQELQKRFNNPKNCMFQGGGYWVSVEQKDAWWYEYPNYLYNEISQSIPWINDADMSYYLSKGHSEIIYKYEIDGGKRPTGKDFKSMTLWTNNPSPNNDRYYHCFKIFYGIQIDSPE